MLGRLACNRGSPRISPPLLEVAYLLGMDLWEARFGTALRWSVLLRRPLGGNHVGTKLRDVKRGGPPGSRCSV